MCDGCGVSYLPPEDPSQSTPCAGGAKVATARAPMAKTQSRTKSKARANVSKSKKAIKPDSEARATVSGPAMPAPAPADTDDDVAAKVKGTQDLAVSFPYNTNKPLEYDPDAAVSPQPGPSATPAD